MVANSVNESEMLDEKDNLYFDLLFESNLYIWNEFFFFLSGSSSDMLDSLTRVIVWICDRL